MKMICEDCDWKGRYDQLDFDAVDHLPVCPSCGSDAVYGEEEDEDDDAQ